MSFDTEFTAMRLALSLSILVFMYLTGPFAENP